MKTLSILATLLFILAFDIAGGSSALAAEQQVSLQSAMRNQTTGFCVDIDGWSSQRNGLNAQLWECNSTGAQIFVYDTVAMTFSLAVNRNYCLDVNQGGTADGTNIQLYQCNGTYAQKFQVQGNIIRSMLNTNKCVDVANANSSNGTNIQLWSCNNTDAQRFALTGNWVALFRWQYAGTYNGQSVTQGDIGCVDKGGRVTSDAQRWVFAPTPESMMVLHTPGECHTVNTADSCVFDVGDNGVTNISFDYDVDPACYVDGNTNPYAGAWFSFWSFPQVWDVNSEFDMIESMWGPNMGGLNMNFAGTGTQQGLTARTHGSILVNFSGQGDNQVRVNMREVTANSGTASKVLNKSRDYFLILDTATTGTKQCSFTISKLRLQGKAHADKPCKGLL